MKNNPSFIVVFVLENLLKSDLLIYLFFASHLPQIEFKLSDERSACC